MLRLFENRRQFRLWSLLLITLFTEQAVAAINQVSGIDQSVLSLTQSEEQKLAEAFAPTLLFHPDEEFFPVSPIFPIDESVQNRKTSELSELEAREIMGDAVQRKEAYLSLGEDKRAKIATVFYRVYPGKAGGTTIIDFWFYYVWNQYRTRPGLFPFWFEGSHPNDLEHVHFTIDSDLIETVLAGKTMQSKMCPEVFTASAHEGLTPANRFRFSRSDTSCEDFQILIEHGSHASAADVNQDGRFVPVQDGDSGYKMVWGIRDLGKTWLRFNPEYMETRDERSIVFYPTGVANSERSKTPTRSRNYEYQLVSVNELTESFKKLDLDDKSRKAIFETKVHWFKRVFGKSNGNSDKLLVPSPPNLDDKPLGVTEHSSTERGFLVGGTTLISDVGVLFGGRYGFLNGSKVFPDLLLQAEGVFTVEGKGYFSTAAILSYPLDAITKLIGGTGLVTDSIDFKNRQWDWFVGLEFRIGSINISTTGRTMGSITNSALDFRLFYMF